MAEFDGDALLDVLAASPLYRHERRAPMPVDNRCRVCKRERRAAVTFTHRYITKSGEPGERRVTACLPCFDRITGQAAITATAPRRRPKRNTQAERVELVARLRAKLAA